MKDVSVEGRTVLFVSHQLGTIKSLCTSGIILKNGEMCFSGTAIDAVNLYVNESSISKPSSAVNFALNESKPAQVLSCKLKNGKGELTSQFDVFDQVILEVEYLF